MVRKRIRRRRFVILQGAGTRRAGKAGLTYDETMRNGVYKNGTVYSYCMYSVLREELEE